MVETDFTYIPTRPKPSPLRMLLGILAGWAIIQGLSIPLSFLVTYIIMPYIEAYSDDIGLHLSMSLLLMIGVWIIVCVTGGYIAGLTSGRRVVVAAIFVGIASSLWVIVPLHPEPMLFTYQYLLPATIVYSSVIGGALALSSDKVIDD